MTVAKKKFDPLANARVVGAKTKGREALDRIEIQDQAVARSVTEYARLDSQKKEAEAAAKPHKEAILAQARAAFANRLASSDDPSSFMLTAGDTSIQVTIPRKIASLGDPELKTLTEDFGRDVVDDLLEKGDKVGLNLKVWEAHADVLISALNALGPDGRRLVPTEVLSALFIRDMKPREDIFQRIVKRTNKNPEQIQTLLFGKLGITPTLSVR